MAAAKVEPDLRLRIPHDRQGGGRGWRPWYHEGERENILWHLVAVMDLTLRELFHPDRGRRGLNLIVGE